MKRIGESNTYFNTLFLNLNESHNPQMVNASTSKYYYNSNFKLLKYSSSCAPESTYKGEDPLGNENTTNFMTLTGNEGTWSSLYNYVIMVEIEVIISGKTEYINVIMEGIDEGVNVNIYFVTNNSSEGNPEYIKAQGTLSSDDIIIIDYSYSGKDYTIAFTSSLDSFYKNTITKAFPIALPTDASLGENYHTTGVFIRQENEVGKESSIMLYSNSCGMLLFNDDQYGDNLASAVQDVHPSSTVENLQLTKGDSQQYPVFQWEKADYIYLSYIVGTGAKSTLFTVRYTLDNVDMKITNIATMKFTNTESTVPSVVSSVDMEQAYTISYTDSADNVSTTFPEGSVKESMIGLDTPISYTTVGAGDDTILYSVEYTSMWYNHADIDSPTASLVSIVVVYSSG